MYVLASDFLHAPLMSFQTGTPLGKVSEAIIDRKKLLAVAWYISGPLLDFHPAVIFSEDIREFGHLGVIIDSSEKILSPTGLVRLKKVTSENFELNKLPVFDDKGQKLGVVDNYSFNADTFDIEQIFVRPSLRLRVFTPEFIIGRKQIVKIEKGKIIVKSPDSKKPLLEQVRPIYPDEIPFENPFRQSRPAPQPKDLNLN